MTRSDALLVAPAGPLINPDSVAISLRRRGSEVQLGRFLPDDGDLRKMPHSARRPAVLRLPRSEVLEKTLVLPTAAESNLEQVLTFEMDRETPFSAEEVYWNYYLEAADRQHGRLSVRLLLLPRGKLADLLASLNKAGLAPRWAEIDGAAAADHYLPLSGERLRPPQGSRRLLLAAAVGCAVMAVGAVATPFARQAVELAALDRAVSTARQAAERAEAVRGDIDRLSRGAELIRGELGNAGRPLDVLAAVTKLLPDDTYLTELDIRQGKLMASGRSAGAARLIGLLAGDGRFRNPAFAAPVTRVEALHAEVFTIVAEPGPAR